MQPRPKYDLQQRTQTFARDVRIFVRKLPVAIFEDDIKQLVRSSGSIAANYLEADEALSKKDFTYRIRICRKEAKESMCWLHFMQMQLSEVLEKERLRLRNETREFVLIFNSIVQKMEKLDPKLRSS